jgi:hypothetical protein
MLIIRRWGAIPTPNLSIGLAAWSSPLSLPHGRPPIFGKKFLPIPREHSRGTWDIYGK